MINIKQICRLRDSYIFINDEDDEGSIIHIEVYINKYKEEVIKYNINGDLVRLVNPTQSEINEMMMFLLNR